MNRTILILSAAICLAIVGEAQAQPDSVWARTYGGAAEDVCLTLMQTTDGGYALAGYTYSFGAGDGDLYLQRTESNGDTLWSRTYNGDGFGSCRSIIQTADGGFALGGTTGEIGPTDYNFWLLRLDANGDSIWSRTYGGNDEDVLRSMAMTTDGGFALAGITRSFGSGMDDFWLLRVNDGGDSLWSRTFGGSGDDECYTLIQTDDGGYALAGSTFTFGAEGGNFWLVKTNEDGDSLWSRTYGGAFVDQCFSLDQTTNGGYTMAGTTDPLGAGGVDETLLCLLRVNDEGDSLYSCTYGVVKDWGYTSLVQTPDEGYAISGSALGRTLNESNFLLQRTNANGDSLWSQTFGGEYRDVCLSMIQTVDGGFALAGYTESFGAGDHDFWLVKTSPDPVSVSGDFIPHPSAFILSPPYPNPFNQSSVISYQLSVASSISLAIYDVAGRVISNQKSVITSPGKHSLIWNAPDVAAGEYMIVLTGDRGQTEARKVVLLK